MMKKAGTRARWWRSHLTKYFVHDANGEIVRTRPEELYDLITQAQWDEFVAMRTSEEFIATSKKNSDAASCNEYPFLRGRRGYAQLEQDLVC